MHRAGGHKVIHMRALPFRLCIHTDANLILKRKRRRSSPTKPEALAADPPIVAKQIGALFLGAERSARGAEEERSVILSESHLRAEFLNDSALSAEFQEGGGICDSKELRDL